MNGSRSDRRLTPCLVSSVRHDMILVQIWRAIFQIFQQKFDSNCFFKFGAKCHAILSAVDNQFDGATFSSEIIETRQTSIGLRRTRSLSFLSSNSSRRSASVAQHFNKTKQKRTVRNNFHRKTISLFHRKLTNLSAQTN